MDVRAVDTSTMAAKRVELDHGQMAKDKRPFAVSRITPRTSQDAGGRVGRSKSSTEREHGGDREHDEREHELLSYTRSAPEAPDAPHDGEHHLDVKV